MSFIDRDLEKYLNSHSSPEPEILQELNRETNLKVPDAGMLSGHLQGRFLAMLSRMIRPNKILEIGTYTGYSAICLCEGLSEKGSLITIDKNVELKDMVQTYLAKAGIQEQVTCLYGDAEKLVGDQEGPFDLVFIDADKYNYALYYDLLIDKMNSNAFFLADNVLWKGRVLDKNVQDKNTISIREFNQKIRLDPRVEKILLPIRDGLSIIRKI
jgi:predicted O-methyltransferase YrrM